jgi:glycine cleavage system H lipoate-binding protein
LAASGFSSLNYNEQLAQLAKFDEPQIYASLPTERVNTLMSVLLLVLVVIVLGGVCIELVFRAFARKSKKVANVIVETVRAFTEDVVDVPKGLYFDKSHSWAFMRKNGLVKVGIDDFLQHVTGKITRIEMKEPGVKIRKGDRLCSILRKGKVLHIYSPVTGTILEANEKLKTNASLLNADPYSEGWIYVIEPVNWELEIQYLQIADRFKANLKNEFQRLKDFLESTMKSLSPDFAYAVLQDGGSFVDHPLAELGPDVWDDFQTKFIDAAK